MTAGIHAFNHPMRRTPGSLPPVLHQESPMPIRPVGAKDRAQVIAMMQALWPGECGFLNGRERVLVWGAPGAGLHGFIFVLRAAFREWV